jgi:predicted  nucleic acid-binding Zn-ribbon protein
MSPSAGNDSYKSFETRDLSRAPDGDGGDEGNGDASSDYGPEATTLRQLLDEFGYYREFSPGSESLIRRLLHDLGQARKGRADGGDISLREELQNELGRLTVENNQLHADLLREMEGHDKDNGQRSVRMRELEDELEGLRVASDANRERFEKCLREKEDMERRAETAEGRARELTERLDRALRSAESAFGPEEREVGNRSLESMLSDGTVILDERIRLLESEISDLDAESERLRGQNERLADELARVRSDLDHSNAERKLALERLASLGSGLMDDAGRHRIAHLESQLNLLRDHVQDLTKNLLEAQEAKKTLQSRHDEQVQKLTKQVKEQKMIASSLQKQLQTKVDSAARKAPPVRPAAQPNVPKPAAKPAPSMPKRAIVPATRIPVPVGDMTQEIKTTKDKLSETQMKCDQQVAEIQTLKQELTGEL